MQQQREAELIARSLNEDHAAYGELVERYKNALYHHCFAITRNEDVAEDIAQDTFITAFYKLHTYKAEYRFSTWLFKIATNKALNWLKKAAREVAADDEMVARVASTQPTPEKEFVYQELHMAVRNLKPKYRAVISLYYWQGLSHKEIATILGAPVGSIKGWAARAKHELRKELS